MSTWTSERGAGVGHRAPPGRGGAPAAVGLAALLLAGCMGEGRLAGLSFAGVLPAGGRPAEPAPALRVARGAVAIAGPAGYCIDPVATRDAGRGAFVLLGSCVAMTGEGRPPARRAVLTAAVSPPGDGPGVAESLETLAGFFGSTTGRGLIARSGEPEAVTLVAAHARDGVLYLRLRDESPFEGAEVAPEYWRAVLDLDRHVVSLSAIPLESRPLRPETTLALLEEFVARTRSENAAPDPVAAAPAMRTPPPPRPTRPPPRSG